MGLKKRESLYCFKQFRQISKPNHANKSHRDCKCKSVIFLFRLFFCCNMLENEWLIITHNVYISNVTTVAKAKAGHQIQQKKAMVYLRRKCPVLGKTRNTKVTKMIKNLSTNFTYFRAIILFIESKKKLNISWND